MKERRHAFRPPRGFNSKCATIRLKAVMSIWKRFENETLEKNYDTFPHEAALFLADFSLDDDSSVRLAALDAFKCLNRAADGFLTLSFLAAFVGMRDPDPRIRHKALEVVSGAYTATLHREVNRLRRDKDLNVRAAAEAMCRTYRLLERHYRQEAACKGKRASNAEQ